MACGDELGPGNGGRQQDGNRLADLPGLWATILPMVDLPGLFSDGAAIMTIKDDYYQLALAARYIAEQTNDPARYERAAKLFKQAGYYANAIEMQIRAQHYREILEGEAK